MHVLFASVKSLHRLALDGLHIDLVQLVDEKFTVLGVDNGLYGSSQNFTYIFSRIPSR